MKRTPWFKGNVRPVRAGPYERNYGSSKDLNVGMCYWNGKWWSWSQENAVDAPDWMTTKSAAQDKPWRGLAEAPE